ncbi:unnamed protein product [Lathyrus sativus]|nr:unnamed protein product [Lathyrus sativus]
MRLGLWHEESLCSVDSRL